MSIVKSFVKFLSDAKAVSKIADLEPGRAGAEGIVRIGEDGHLVSPVRGNHCVAFYYKAFHFVGSRTGQMMPRKLRVEEVYHSFELELEDGRIKAIPKKSDQFTSDDHKALSGVGYEGFRATEDLVSAGNQVRVFGVAKREGDDWVLRYSKLEVISTSTGAEGSSSKKKKKKKAKKKVKH